MRGTCAIILAAGKGTRMNSHRPKVLAQVLFRPMLGYVLEACQKAGIARENICVVTGYESQQVEDYLESLGGFHTVKQSEQKGTGHAVMMADSFLQAHEKDDVLILNGDAPCIDADTIQKAHAMHVSEQNAATLITAVLDNPASYGRIIRNSDGQIEKIVEKKDANQYELEVKEINSGEYWFQVEHLRHMLGLLEPNNAQGEYYLTDTIGLSLTHGKTVGGYTAQNTDVVLGANSRSDLYQLSEKMRWEIIRYHMAQGVEFVSTDGVYICPGVSIGADTVILPGTILKTGTVVGENCTLGPNTLVENSVIGNRVKLNAVQCYQSRIDDDVDIGPFVHIRPNSEIHHHVHIGDFVEVKNSTIGAGTAVAHLTYVGDSDVGKNVNFGCGVVTVNYDGVHKNRCTIKDGAFIGCNTNLVAPVTVGENGYTAAGSTVTEDVPDEALAIARARQINKEGFSTKKLAGRKKKV